eukprot:5055830-Pyramimonas_sp.AAC.2
MGARENAVDALATCVGRDGVLMRAWGTGQRVATGRRGSALATARQRGVILLGAPWASYGPSSGPGEIQVLVVVPPWESPLIAS